MPHKVRIALDAMGGDHGAAVVVPGAELSLSRHPGIEFLLFGDRTVVEPLLEARPRLKAAAQLVHTDVSVKMHDKPSQALRNGRWKSSMWLAIDAVRKGEADAAISAGNTGALMAMAKFNLRTMARIERPAIAALWPTLRGESIVLDLGASIGADSGHLVDLAAMGGAMARVVFGLERPAIAARWPTLRGESIVLDLGATIGADAHHLIDLAVMGSAMARVLFNLERPSVGLLNIGVEEVKGLEPVREAGRTLRELNLPFLDYTGFVEGDDIGKGTVDVVVTEGFAGNIALKAAEGTARQLAQHLKTAMARTIWSRIGYLFARDAFRALAEKMDPRQSNGGVFLGLNGIVIKSHGGTDAEGYASAIEIGYEMVHQDLLAKIRHALTIHDRDSGPARLA